MKINTSLFQTQKTILAPAMQQSIEMLMVAHGELAQAIEKELQENPVLEIDSSDNENSESNNLEEMVTQSIQQIQKSNEDDFYEHSHYDPDDIDDRPITKTAVLDDHLLQQLELEICDPLERKIGEAIIGNLDHDGYLKISCEDINTLLKINDLQKVEIVLQKIQHFDPLGVAARDLKECLHIQIPYFFNGHSECVHTLVQNHLEDLASKKFVNISRKMKLSIDDIKDLAKRLSHLEPKPGRKYRPGENHIYITPDVSIIKNVDGHWVAHINNESVPQLRVSPLFKKMLRKGNLSKEESEFIREKIKNGLLFIRSIEQRHTTVRAIADFILKHQEKFWNEGHLALKPLTLREVAQVIDRNESTVCRAINGKYMDTPQGLLPMKYFFSQAMPQSDNKASLSNQSLKEELLSIVEAENKAKPLSDLEIQNIFLKRDIQVARRTISKYRKLMNIPASHLRKN